MKVRTVRSAALLVGALLLPAVGVVATLLPVSSAWAQTAPVFEGGALVELLPPTGLVGDGITASDVFILALNADGTPLSGLKGRPTATTGNATDLAEIGGGLYKFAYTPGKTSVRVDATLTLKAKTAAKEPVNRTWSVAVNPAVSHPITVVPNPTSMTLGQDKQASLTITLVGADSIAAANAELRLSTSSGSIGNATNLGNGQFSALYTAPNELFPRIALITASDRHDPSRSYGGVAIPLVGKADFPVTVGPNAKVIIRVGGREFGPVQADGNGKAKVPIVVPPGASNASLVQVGADGKTTESPLDLKIPESRRIQLFPMSAALPGDAGVGVAVRVLVVTPDGKPDGNAQVSLTPSTGTMSPPRHEGGGVYVATYTPPNALYEGTVGITASLTGGSKEQTDKVDVKLLPMRASEVKLTANPATLAAGADSFSVTATVSGTGGTALPGRTVSFTANGAKLKDMKDLKNGTYQANFTTTGTGPVEVSALSGVTAGANPLSRVLIVPARTSVPNDGLSSAPFLVITVDDYGYPVANQGVSLRVVTGDGTIPAAVTTGADGTSLVYYTAGRKNTIVSVEAAAGGTTAAGSLLQVQAGVGTPSLPTGGPKSVADLANGWSKALGGLRVERAGSTGAAATVAAPTATAAAAPASTAAPTASATTVLPTPPPGGTTPAKIQAVSDPAQIAPGTTTHLRIVVTDAAGKGVGGQGLDFMASAGAVSTPRDVGSGVYSATLAIPANTSGEVRVAISTRDGTVSSILRVPIGQAAAGMTATRPTTTAPAATPAATPAASPAPATVVTPSTPTTTAEAWGSGSTATTATPASTPTMSASRPEAQPAATPTAATPTATTPAPAATPAPASTSSSTTAKAPRPADDHPFLRIRAGAVVAGYAYTQTPLAQDTSLFPAAMEIATGAQGFGLNARYFQPGFQYLGAEVNVRGATYALDPTSLCDRLGRPCEGAGAVSDWIMEVHALGIARYTFTSGESRYWGGARIGYGYGDMQGIQASGDAIDFPQFRVSALGIGAEVGAEFMNGRLFVNPAFTEYLAGGSSPYHTNFTAEVGYAFLENVYASLTYDLSARKVSVLNGDNNKVGEIADTMNAVTISLGAQL